mmetsp:Transcript_32576/g.103783  ORF Transcript_32576/g.103783 Transcript_32576/m.103783 type:complete len:1598 (-) Transcript_32576:13-4806(-)
MPGVTNASGLLALLEEEDDRLKVHALKHLVELVDEHWFQVSASISHIESLYEDESFPEREIAALLASKVFYHLGELQDALTYALGAGNMFDVSGTSEYVETLVAKCVDEYVDLSVKADGGDAVDIDPRLVAIVERMFDRCLRDRQYQQAIGIALECRRLDKLEMAMQAGDLAEMLAYTLSVSQTHVVSREFRQRVLRVLVKLYESVASPDYVSVCQCLMFLDDPSGVAKILDKLLHGDEDSNLMAYQVAFDLAENDQQSFLLRVKDVLQALAPARPRAEGAAPAAPAAGTEGADDAMDTADGAAPAAPAPEPAAAEEAPPLSPYHVALDKLVSVLTGDVPIQLLMEFLYSKNHADLLILKNIKAAVEPRNSVCHSATILCNALMHAGTTVDTFLRENLDWLSRATNWAKFSATAGLGAIHRGHLSRGRDLMAPYLPRDGASGSPYSEGGALYALGLIHANHGEGIKPFLLESLRSTQNEVIQHGACLGLGLAAMGTGDDEVYEDLKGVLYTDSAVAGEAAGFAMGLLLVGTCSEKAAEMLAYAHDTQHEKIIRGLAAGVSLVVFGREEEADTLIEQMTGDQDPILRYGGMYAIAMAYRGTGNNSAIRRLLHFAVSDVSDDVRRTAVLALGFVLLSSPEQCPRIVSLLAESYNPHVRYGAAMAVGISCAGTGLAEAVALLEPLATDAVDFVRQGALIAMAMVLVQQPEAKLASFRKQLDKLVGDKHEDTMCKMGAIMASGIIDAGGRNVTIGLRSKSGYMRMTSIVSLSIFTQYWYWYPLSYFISLSFTPTALVALNGDLKMPKMAVTSGCKPSAFAYLPPISNEKKAEATKVQTAVLSTTARAKAKKDKKDKEEGKENKEEGNKDAAGGDKMETDDKEGEKKGGEGAGGEKKEKKAREPSSFAVDNPARVVPGQERFIRFEEGEGARYVPVKSRPAGILIMKDTKPGEEVELVSNAAPAAPAAPAAASTPAPTAFDSGGLPAPWDAFTPAPTAAAGGANEPLMIEAANAFFAAVATANKPEAAQAAALDTLRNFLTAGYSGLGPHGTEFGTSNLGALVDGSIDVAIPPAATRKYAAAGDLTLIAYFTWETGVELTQVALVAIHEFVYDGPAVDQLRIDSTHFLVSSVPNGARDKVEEFYRATDLPADQSAEAMSILEGILAPGFEFVSDQGTIPRDAFLARVAAGMTGSAGVTTREIVASSSVVIAHYEFTDGATGLAFHGATVFHFARGNIAKVMWYHEEAQAKRNQLRTISAFYDVFDNRNATVLSLNDLVTQDFLVHSSHGSTANLTEFESRLLRMRAYMSNSTMMMDVNTTRQVSVDGNYAYTWFDNGINGLHMHGASVFRFQDVGGSLKLAEWWSYLEASPPAFRETVDSFLKVLSDSSGMPEGDRRGFLEANLLPLLADDYVASATGTANSTHLVDWALQWAVEDGPYTYEDVRLRADGSWVTAQFNLTGPNVNNGKGQDLIILFHMGWGSPPTIRMSMHFWHDIITPYKTNLAAFYESVVDGNPEEIDGMVVPGYVAYLKDTGETLDLAGFKAQVEIWKNHSVSDRREYLEDGNKVVSNYEMVVDGETRKGATVHTFESGTGLILESDFF